MRVALVHLRHSGVGGTEQLLDALAAHLAERGDDVTIVCRRHAATAHARVRFEVLHGLALGAAWRMWSFAREVERYVARERHDVVLALGKTWSHDVIRTGGGSHATFLERAREFEGRRAGLKDRVALAIERRAYAPGAYQRVIANSAMVARDMRDRYGVREREIAIIPNGVDLERFHPRESARGRELRRELGLADGDFVFLFLGSGFARKGLERLLRAFREVASARSDARLLVVGRDGGAARFIELARELGLSQVVRFAGERRDAPACFAACDVHVLPTWYDSFGFTVLESFASARPVITTDAAGAAELVDRGVHGDVLPGNCAPGPLARCLLEWCDRDRARRAGESARERAEQYGFARTLGEIADVLVEVARRA